MARKAAAIKRPRRKPGTGGVRYRTGREKPYEAYFPIPDHPPRYESFHTAVQAEAWLDELCAAQQKGTRDLAGGSMLIQDYLPIWLELQAPHVSPKTLESYTYYCRYACGEGGIGRIRLDDLVHLTAQRMINTLAAGGFKNTPQLKAVLYQAFEYAADPLEYITKNPFRKVKVPPIERKEGIAITKAQRDQLLAAAAVDDATECWWTDRSDPSVPPRTRKRLRGLPAPLLPFWHLTSRLAFRRGEADGLRWRNIDMDAATITISSTRGRLGAGHTEGKTKTKKPRTVPIPPDLVEVLRAFKTTQMRAALAHGWRWTEDGYVFADDRTGDPISVDHLRHRWTHIKQAANLPEKMTIHDLRVTALTILALDGVPANVRKALSGHSTARMDEHYTSHAALDDVRRALG